MSDDLHQWPSGQWLFSDRCYKCGKRRDDPSIATSSQAFRPCDGAPKSRTQGEIPGCNEAAITINGQPLTFGQSMMLRCAVEALAASLADDGLGDDDHGRAMAAGYMARIGEIRRLMGITDATGPENPAETGTPGG